MSSSTALNNGMCKFWDRERRAGYHNRTQNGCMSLILVVLNPLPSEVTKVQHTYMRKLLLLKREPGKSPVAS
jgi:hypothetical protein